MQKGNLGSHLKFKYDVAHTLKMPQKIINDHGIVCLSFGTFSSSRAFALHRTLVPAEGQPAAWLLGAERTAVFLVAT